MPNKGTMIGPIVLDKPEDCWSATCKEKRSIYGRRGRIAVGGKNPDGQDGKRNDDDWEPVFWWAPPVQFYEELLHRWPAAAQSLASRCQHTSLSLQVSARLSLSGGECTSKEK